MRCGLPNGYFPLPCGACGAQDALPEAPGTPPPPPPRSTAGAMAATAAHHRCLAFGAPGPAGPCVTPPPRPLAPVGRGGEHPPDVCGACPGQCRRGTGRRVGRPPQVCGRQGRSSALTHKSTPPPPCPHSALRVCARACACARAHICVRLCVHWGAVTNPHGRLLHIEAATNRQPPTTNRHQPPTANHQLPPTARCCTCFIGPPHSGRRLDAPGLLLRGRGRSQWTDCHPEPVHAPAHYHDHHREIVHMGGGGGSFG